MVPSVLANSLILRSEPEKIVSVSEWQGASLHQHSQEQAGNCATQTQASALSPRSQSSARNPDVPEGYKPAHSQTAGQTERKRIGIGHAHFSRAFFSRLSFNASCAKSLSSSRMKVCGGKAVLF